MKPNGLRDKRGTLQTSILAEYKRSECLCSFTPLAETRLAGLSRREITERYRQDQTCAGSHVRIDSNVTTLERFTKSDRDGMDLHGMKVNPPGYQGAFREDADGRGYTLEYAIPWQLLNAADDPPRAGDELAAMWLVHWSDPAGRNWQGQLIDVMKPNGPGWNFLRSATWGKAIYVRNP